jgi:hypothetical protein
VVGRNLCGTKCSTEMYDGLNVREREVYAGYIGRHRREVCMTEQGVYRLDERGMLI